MKKFSLCLALLSCILGVTNMYAADAPTASNDVVTQMAARQFDKVEARFDSEMSSALPVDKLSASWDAAIAKYGNFKSITGTRAQDVKGYRSVRVTCQFEHAVMDVKVVWNGQDQISGLWIVPPSQNAK